MNEYSGFPDEVYPVDHSARSEAVGWVVMVALAFLFFELTADPSIAVVIGCMKFGTRDLRIARRLRHADPDRTRGRACSWFYVARAIMGIGFIAFFLLFVLITVNGPGMPKGQLERQLLSSLFVILGCMAGAALASWKAVYSALRHRVCVWMDATATSALRAGAWPPFLPDNYRRANLGPGLIVVYAIVSAGIAFVSTSLIAVVLLLGGGGIQYVIALAVEMLAMIVLIFRLMPRLIGKIEATDPWQCYGEHLLESYTTQ